MGLKIKFLNLQYIWSQI